MNGDMNYRIDQRREAVIAAVKAGDIEHLLVHDQLRKEMKFNRAFRLRHFSEGPLDYAPTYKYDRLRKVDEARIISVCCGLVRVDKDGNQVRLIREFTLLIIRIARSAY